MATKNICTVPMSTDFGFDTNAIVEENGELKRINLEQEFNQKASRIYCEAEGESVFVEDSAEARFKNIALLGKSKQETTKGYQLFNANNCEGVGSNESIEVSEDTYTITATGGVSAGYGFSKFPLDISKCVGKTLFMKVDSITGGTGSAAMLYGFKGGANAVSYTLKPGDTSIECPIADDIEEVKVYVYTNTSGTVFTDKNTVIIKGLMVSYYEDAEWEKFTGGMAAPNSDYTQEIEGIENPEIMVYGKNLLSYPYLHTTVTKNGATFTVQEDGGVAGSGTPTDYADMWIYDGVPAAKHGIVAFSLQGTFKNMAGSLALYDENNNSLISRSVYYNDKPITIDLDQFPTAARWLVLLKRSEVNVEMSGVVYPQIQIEEMSEYEKYKSLQTLTLPYTLHGIPVSSGGNYTDADGQQWISDEIDLERGVYIQRIQKITLDENTQIWTGAHANGQTYIAVYPGDNVDTSIVRSTHYRHTPVNWSNENGYIYCINTAIVLLDSRFSTAEEAKRIFGEEKPEIMYILKEPIETPLTDAEIYAFKQLKSNYPNTTILNAAGAHMKAEYAADTEKFIKNCVINTMFETIENCCKTYIDTKILGGAS